jgi:hypothetical protein
MKYEIEVIRETRNKDIFYVEANSKEEAKDYVYENPDSWDNTEEYDVSYWDIISVEEQND